MTAYPIALARPDPLIQGYATLCRHNAHRQRRHYAQLLDRANNVIANELDSHTELSARIKTLRQRIAARQRGVPLTEVMDDPGGVSLQDSFGSEEERLAHQFLLKKAWRKVRTIAHPDKGGSKEEFQILKDAYHAGDLRALTEYVISLEKELLEQIAYWHDEAKRPDVEWKIIQSSPHFKIVRAVMTGNAHLASSIAESLLVSRVRELELEALNFGVDLKP